VKVGGAVYLGGKRAYARAAVSESASEVWRAAQSQVGHENDGGLAPP